MMGRVISVIAYIALAPFIGGLLEGADRKISARMQRRIGPPLLQPFYDVKKLFSKEWITVTDTQILLLLVWMALVIFTGGMFFSGTDVLMCFFMQSTAGIFLYFTACVTDSPYSMIGAQRELIQEMACEPAILMTGLGFYLVRDSFEGVKIISGQFSPIMYMPGFFAAYVFIMIIKMRKSPFDESTSHHAHQELVKGITTELGSTSLALYQITEWYETVFLLGVVGMFVLNSSAASIPAAIAVILLVYLFIVLIDNTSARMKWGSMLQLAWGVTLTLGGVNLIILILLR